MYKVQTRVEHERQVYENGTNTFTE